MLYFNLTYVKFQLTLTQTTETEFCGKNLVSEGRGNARNRVLGKKLGFEGVI